MKRKVMQIFKKRFVKNVMIVASGTVAAQAVTMALSPIITRLYGPEAFGVLGLFTAIIAVIAPLAALTYPIAIVLPKSDQMAKSVMRLSIYISLTLSVVSLIIILLFNSSISKLLNIEAISSFIFYIPLVILFSGILQVCEQWLIRKKKYRITAKVTFFQAVIFQGSKVGVGLYYPIAASLIILTVFSQLGKALMLLIGIRGTKELVNETEGSPSVVKALKKYKDFPLFRAPEVFLNSISQGLPIVVLTSLFGPASAGFYTIGRTVLSIPAQLVGKAIGDVFYPRISEAANNEENLTKLIKKATLLLTLIGIIPFGLIILAGPSLFIFVFGNEWGIAGEYARWISLWSFCAFINRPSIMALPVLSAQAFHLKFTILMLIIRIAALFSGYYFFGTDTMTVALFSISGAFLNVLLILLTIKKSSNFDEINQR